MNPKNNKDKICIIGGSGFIGTRLINNLENKKIVNLDKKVNLNTKHENIKIDVRDLSSFKNKLEGVGCIVLLAAEHVDNLSNPNGYYETNVEGAKNVIKAMSINAINHIIFTSTVAVYGLKNIYPDEYHNCEPFNHYGKSKLEAENILIKWYNENPTSRRLDIIRPTVIFGEGNRGNIYNLIKQISDKNFLMIGDGKNKKSIAYVGNLVAFIKQLLYSPNNGFEIYNFTDKPDMSMKEMIMMIKKELGQNKSYFYLPKFIGIIFGAIFDIFSKILKIKNNVSLVRIKKFCANTTINSKKLNSTNFIPPYKIVEALKKTIKHDFKI